MAAEKQTVGLKLDPVINPELAAKFKELQGQAMANEKIANAQETVLEWETKAKDLKAQFNELTDQPIMQIWKNRFLL